MKTLLENSKKQLLAPSAQVKRKIIILLNITYVILTISFLSSEKITSGYFVPINELYIVYFLAIVLNTFSALYNIKVILFKLGKTSINSWIWEVTIKQNEIFYEKLFATLSIGSVMLMSACNMLGIGNPSNDAILTDFALGHSLILVAVLVINRKGALIWFLIVFLLLIYDTSRLGWDYQYHYMTPSEVESYEAALKNQEDWAVKRKEELKANGLNSPKVTRYFNTWAIFIIVSFMIAYSFYGITSNILKVIPDVIKNIEQAIQNSVKVDYELKQNEASINAFINLSHEFKTPLTLIRNYLDELYIKHGRSDELDAINISVNKILRDVVNFFDHHRISKGIKFYNHDQIVDFSEILMQTIIAYKPIAKKKDISLNLNIKDNNFVKADSSALSRIINNLIDNSIKYSVSGDKIDINLNSENDFIIFSVQDNGIGIPEEKLEAIFQPYYQISSKKNAIDGMGLGLPMIQSIIEELGGELKVISEENKGSTFTVKLLKQSDSKGDKLERYQNYNIALQEYLPTKNDKPKDIIHDTNKPFIMIVEDNYEMSVFLSNTLKDNYNLYIANNGSDAFDKLQKGIHVDLIISDIMMPKMDGYDFRKKVLISNYNHIPFMFLTAKSKEINDSDVDLEEVYYISKPFRKDDLQRKIKTILSVLRKQRIAIVNNAYISLNKNNNHIEHSNELLDDEVILNCKRFELTPKETEIARAIIEGLTYQEISDNMNVSLATIKKHVQNTFKKVDVRNKVGLIKKLQA
ncbi:ATP-binding response regulator [Chondrinema litorale]|uniref:ATP-binding response regulator n=1 Tax=Chondrinema litorale TaxID=2994555 RepID=UPI0025431F08|nr:ATP-binding protein [Chondrinema litorale]UZS00038.1 ATP-binding protein [Chondrinema litorale]